MDGGVARERILNALVELVARDGYSGVTAERVAERAGVSPADFSRTFDDLDACLLAVVDMAAQGAIRAVQQAAAEAARTTPMRDPDERLEHIFEPSLRALLACVAAKPDRARVCLVEVATIGARGLAKRDAALERFVQLLEDALPEQPERPSQLVSEMVVGGIHELLQRRARIRDTAGLPELAPALTAVWLPVLRGAR
jgi:AcrR family transcriptional regulator